MNLGMYMAEGKNYKSNNQTYTPKKFYNDENIKNDSREKENKTSEKSKVRIIEVGEDNEE